MQPSWWKSIENYPELKGGKPCSFKSVPQAFPAAEYGEISTYVIHIIYVTQYVTMMTMLMLTMTMLTIMSMLMFTRTTGDVCTLCHMIIVTCIGRVEAISSNCCASEWKLKSGWVGSAWLGKETKWWNRYMCIFQGDTINVGQNVLCNSKTLEVFEIDAGLKCWRPRYWTLAWSGRASLLLPSICIPFSIYCRFGWFFKMRENTKILAASVQWILGGCCSWWIQIGPRSFLVFYHVSLGWVGRLRVFYHASLPMSFTAYWC